MWNTGMGSTIASIMLMYAMFQQYFPYHLQQKIHKYTQYIFGRVNPYIQITIHEYSGGRFKRSEAYMAIETYLSAKSSKQAKRLKADIGKNSKNLVLSMDDLEEVIDEYQGVQLWWASRKTVTTQQSVSLYPGNADDKRYYTLKFHKKFRGLVVDSYLNHVFEAAKELGMKNRQRKLYTNNPSDNWQGYKSSVWSHVVFNHPSTFQTMALDADKKTDILNDLTTFSTAKDYYAKIGKAWKRGYLLYGPPGTGKSTMIAAIANMLEYDIYDLELTSVKNNNELRKLLIETSNKSIIVIEDIDCSLDLTGQRKNKKSKEEEKVGEDPIAKKAKEEETSSNEGSKVTLSGLLNFIDGLWSACGEERLIIFTTNHVEKLDPALIRRGRMDKHIELSYCSFGAFKVLAKNYLDLESHHLFETIKHLLEETQMTPADVAENLMPKTINGNFAELCLENLIQALENTKEEAKLKAGEEAKERDSSTKDEAVVNQMLTNNEAKLNDTTLLE
ncbi:Aaa-atpase [Thalictrum thalictroides]|uniref:Aaa-atpase n=1 Tax=Thalictrum thalictroides TaxID=46969 RepID=A0A7J6W045_THATH|nr:Aaa-atpase [Thalictrum thalictroides]